MWDDERLLAELGAAVREAQVPDSFVRIGKAAFAWRTVDAELAALQADSRQSEAEPSGMRSRQDDTGPRTLGFATRELSIEIEIHHDAVRGQLIPTQAGTVRVRDDAGIGPDIVIDEVGWFVIEPAPTRRFRLHVRTAAGAAILTDWIAL